MEGVALSICRHKHARLPHASYDLPLLEPLPELMGARELGELTTTDELAPERVEVGYFGPSQAGVGNPVNCFELCANGSAAAGRSDCNGSGID